MHRSSEEIDADIASQSRVCSCCGVRKGFGEFSASTSSRDGVGSNCLRCRRADANARTARKRAARDANGRVVGHRRTAAQVSEDRALGSRVCFACRVRKPFSEYSCTLGTCKECKTPAMSKRDIRRAAALAGALSERGGCRRCHRLGCHNVLSDLQILRGGLVCSVACRNVRRRISITDLVGFEAAWSDQDRFPTVADVAAFLGVSVGKAGTVAASLGLRRENRQTRATRLWRESVDMAEFRDAWHDLVGLTTLEDVGAKFGVSDHVVRKFAEHLGWQKRPRNASTRLIHVTQDGYQQMRVGADHKFACMAFSKGAGAGRVIPVHRLVMALHLDRPLVGDVGGGQVEETVHHRNGVRDDNRLENLEHRWGQHGSGADYDATAGRVAEQADEIDELRAEVERLRSILGEVAA